MHPNRPGLPFGLLGAVRGICRREPPREKIACGRVGLWGELW
jgi:hypothetical protein